jgi:hypothetical protein
MTSICDVLRLGPLPLDAIVRSMGPGIRRADVERELDTLLEAGVVDVSLSDRCPPVDRPQRLFHLTGR